MGQQTLAGSSRVVIGAPESAERLTESVKGPLTIRSTGSLMHPQLAGLTMWFQVSQDAYCGSSVYQY